VQGCGRGEVSRSTKSPLLVSYHPASRHFSHVAGRSGSHPPRFLLGVEHEERGKPAT